MVQPLLKVKDLKTWFDTPEGIVRAVDGVSFDIARGETLALLGESGCGKSIGALSLLQLVPQPAGRIVSGEVVLGGQDILRLPEREMRRLRGRRIAMVFQEPQTSLNPVLTVGSQIHEALPDKGNIGAQAPRARAVALLKAVGIADPERRYWEYPHQLSGGMKQRVMIAMALAGGPDLLIADEPTTALDVTIQAQILALLQDLQQRSGMGILLITHDLGVVATVADRVAVMYAGQIVEIARREEFFSQPLHPYAQKLFRSVPGRGRRGHTLEVISGSVPSLRATFPGCRFVDRCDRAWDRCRTDTPHWIERGARGVRCHLFDPEEVGRPHPAVAAQPPAMIQAVTPIASPSQALLQVSHLKVHFPIHRGVLRRVVGCVKAVDGVSLAIATGRTLALVGESGCGKTTVGKGILQLIRPTAGSVIFSEQELTRLSVGSLRRLRHELQIIFQDPVASLNPRMLVGDIVAEGIRALDARSHRQQRLARVEKLLERVGLPGDTMQRYPHEFSGGQRQRISIARALALDPKLIVCDEPTSALDVSVQAQILNLLKELQGTLGLSFLFITHDLSVVEYLAHDVTVMYLGRVVESGRADEVLESPRHPYTRALLSAVPAIEPSSQRPVIRLEGDIPSPSAPPVGCHFHPRCPEAMAVCKQSYPGQARFGETHYACCHLYPSGS
ncbi:MAG: dipeptide ABC transporter ATP-binding protein [Gammaproteobacteria bacterium]|nr:MAG: dipeptide ABC transporter ATP-binding protein [Gammaproteobacteria bacterium]